MSGDRRASTVVTTNADGSQTRARAVGAVVRRIVPTSAAVGKPETLARLMLDVYRELDEATAAARGNAFSGAVLLAGIAFTGGAALTIAHGLGRPYQGFLCVRAQTAAWSGYEQPLPSGQSSSTYIKLVTGTTGTFDIMVF